MFDSDSWLIRQQFRIIIGAILLVFISFIMSWNEVKYMIWAKKIDVQGARVSVMQDRETKKILSMEKLEVYFTDGALNRHEWLTIPKNWSPTPDVTVEYLPGKEGAARLLGVNNMIWVYIFVGSILAFVGFILYNQFTARKR